MKPLVKDVTRTTKELMTELLDPRSLKAAGHEVGREFPAIGGDDGVASLEPVDGPRLIEGDVGAAGATEGAEVEPNEISLGPSALVHSLKDVIAFNEAHADEELRYFGQDIMTKSDAKGPLTSPAYPPGPYRFVNREYLIVTYRTDPARLRAVFSLRTALLNGSSARRW